MLLSNAFRPDPRVLKEARTLAAAGYAVTVVAWDREAAFPAEERTGGFAVQRVQGVRSRYGAGLRQALRLPLFWLEAWRRLSRLQPDAVHCHDFDTLPAGWLWAKLHRRPVVYDAHEYYAELQRPRLRGPVGRALLAAVEAAEQLLSRTAAAVITVDERIARRYHHPRLVIVGHYPPLDFAPPPDHRSLATDPGSPSTVHRPPTTVHRPPTLVYAGRLSVDRGLLVTAQALQRLAAQGLRPRLRLLGVWTSAAEEAAFRDAMAGLEGQVEALGWVPFAQVPGYLASADVALALLQPIERYVVALPVKLFEYMACGLPVVISDFPPNRAVVAAADCGVLVDPTDVDAVAAALARLLTDPAEAQRLGQNGRRAFEAQYNWQALEPRLLGLYRALWEETGMRDSGRP